jgi:hypothetical protein
VLLGGAATQGTCFSAGRATPARSHIIALTVYLTVAITRSSLTRHAGNTDKDAYVDTFFIYKLLLSAPFGFAAGFALARRYRVAVALPVGLATGVAWFVLGAILDTQSLNAGCSSGSDCNSAAWAIIILGPINSILFAIGLVPGLLVGRVAHPAD